METNEFLDLFIAEAREHLDGLSGLLAKARRDGLAGEEINDLFRHAHSLKGMALSLGLRPISGLAHALEDVLHDWRGGLLQPPPPLLDVMVQVSDHLAIQVDAVAAGQEPPPAGDLAGALRRACSSSSSPVVPGPPQTAPAGPPPDIGADPAPDTTLDLEIALAPDTPLPAARALVVLKRLAEHGRVARVAPPVETISSGAFAGRFTVTVATRIGAERLADLVRGLPDVADCQVRSTRAGGGAPGEQRSGADRRVGPDRRAHEEAGAGPHDATARGEAVPTVRVATGRMDRLLDGIGELILERERLQRAVRPEPGSAPAARLESLGRTIAALRDEVMQMRLIPFASIVPRLQRLVRDVGHRLGKPVDLEVRGTEISLDRSILEELVDPLEHLLRNAIDHGIEPREARRQGGKPETGRIRIALDRQEERTILQVSDDGRGIDPAALLRLAVERRFITREAAARMGDDEALMLITLPGFSTASRTTDISGRGVGMDVVRLRVQKIGGQLVIASEPGRGTRLEMALPASLTVTRALLCRAGDDLYAVPVAAVHSTLDVARAAIESSQGEQITRRQDHEVVTLLPLAAALGCGDGGAGLPDPYPALVYRVGHRAYALGVEEIVGEQEIVVKPLRHPLELLPQYAGAAVLDDGRIALILDPVYLTRTARPAA